MEGLQGWKCLQQALHRIMHARTAQTNVCMQACRRKCMHRLQPSSAAAALAQVDVRRLAVQLMLKPHLCLAGSDIAAEMHDCIRAAVNLHGLGRARRVALLTASQICAIDARCVLLLLLCSSADWPSGREHSKVLLLSIWC